MKLLEYLGIFAGGPEEVEVRVGELGEPGLGLGVLGVAGTVGVGEMVEGLVLIMTDGRAWVEGRGGRSGSSVVIESTGVWVPESEYCLPQVG